MLRELLLRDWILHRRVLLISYTIFGAFQIYSALRVSSPRAWLVFASLYAGLLTLVVFAREDKFRSTAWTCSLPVSRRQIVRARIVGAWILISITLVAATVLCALLPGSKVSIASIVQPTNLLISLGLVTLIVAVMLPFTIRFGLMGVLMFGIVAQLLGGGLLVVAMLSNSRGKGGTGRPILDALSSVTEGLVAARAALSPVVFQILVLAIFVALNWFGYRFSTFLFRRIEL
jgi:ABC-type transport system involved in multi-copper enzyme maturation permease subunit